MAALNISFGSKGLDVRSFVLGLVAGAGSISLARFLLRTALGGGGSSRGYDRASQDVLQEISAALAGLHEAVKAINATLASSSSSLRDHHTSSSSSVHKSRSRSRSRHGSSRHGGSGDEDEDDDEFFDLDDAFGAGRDGMTFEENVRIQPLDDTDALNLFEMLDQMRNENKRHEAAKLLLDKSGEVPHSVQLVWRLARAYVDIAEHDLPNEQTHLEQSRAYAQQAVEMDETCADAYKWLAISTGSLAKFQPMKDKVAFGVAFKTHIEKAIALRPEDPSNHHLLGRWCYEIATLSWFERKAANAIFALPNVTLDDTLACFAKAEELKPDFWKSNTVMMGKTYYKMGKYAEAKTWLQKSLLLPAVSHEDEKLAEEAKNLIASL